MHRSRVTARLFPFARSRADAPKVGKKSGGGPFRSWRALLVVLSSTALPAALLPNVAVAVGAAVVGVSVTPVTATGDPQTSFGHPSVTGTDALRYRVSYSCAVVTCTNTTVKFPPSGLDPTYNQFRLLAPVPAAWTAPFTGATITGNANDGVTVNLGDLPAGSSGTFVVVYGGNRPRFYTIHNEIMPPAYFPPGYQIEMSATIESTSATLPATADADPVSWNIHVPDNPGIAKAGPGDVRAGEEATYSIYMNSGCLTQAGSGHITAPGRILCAREFTVIEHLPAEAVYISSSDGGVYDATSHTVTWAVSGPGAAGGFGRAGGCCWSPTREYHPRTVTVVYPGDRFPAGAGGADFTATVTNRVTVDMTYLDGSTGTAEAKRSHVVARYAPFAKATFSAKDAASTGSDGTVRLNRVPPDTTGETCPPSGQDNWGRACTPGGPVAPFAPNGYYWRHVTYNQANVPGVAVVEDDVDHPGTEVYQIWTNPGGAQVEYVLDDGTAGTGTTHPTSLVLTPPAGRHFVRAKLTSRALPGPNARPDGTASTAFDVRFYYRVPTSAPVGVERTNTIVARMTYPDHPQLAEITNAASPQQFRTIRFVETPGAVLVPRLSAELLSPTVEGGGAAVPGRNVTFRVRGRTAYVPETADITPQYVFVAPAGWVITPGSASFPPSSVPAGVTFRYRTVTIGGVARPAVVAGWPDSVSFGRNAYWPVMSVMAQPTSAVPAGTRSVAEAYTGDSRHTWDNTEALYQTPYKDAADLDGDGTSTDWFSAVGQSIAVSSADALNAIKEICQPDADATDGCHWISNPDIVVGVAPTASDIRYRITLVNTGNTQLNNVVGYDVLPHRDDHGTSAGTAGTRRGSTVGLTLSGVSGVPAGLALSFSRSTNPCREEVHPSAPACDPDWAAPVAGAAAIHMRYGGALGPGERISFVYNAALQPGAPADAIACNSVAIASDRTLPTEPRNVCATTQEADLELSVPERLPLQVGRPGVVPFMVDNHGGSPRSAATATIGIPAGVTVTNLNPPGWRCTPEGTHPDSTAVGRTTLTCEAVTDAGALREVPVDAREPLHLDVRPDRSVAGQTVCFDGVVAGPMFDPDRDNNDARSCFAVSAPDAPLLIDKTDGRAVVGTNEEYTYTVTVTNQLVGETVRGATMVDTLPPGLVFVSATMGGSHRDAGPADAFGDASGGTVTWALPDLAPAGVPTAEGATTGGNPGSSVVLAVTVRVVAGATGDVVNTARVDAPDPADPAATLCPDSGCAASDTDRLRALRVTKSSNAAPIGVRAGDEVTYTVTATSTGTADHTKSDPASIHDDISGVLDEARFVPGSARVSVAGQPAVAVADPTGNVLVWSGALPAGRNAVLTYRVVVENRDGDGRLINTAFAAPPSSCDPATGTDAGRRSCATHIVAFATTLLKSVGSVRQSDDGRWVVVYHLDVANLVDDAPARYDLSDELRFGDGIDVVSATLSRLPPGVTPASPAWDGRAHTAIATGVVLPPGGTHRYEVTVLADAHRVAGTPAGQCRSGGEPGGFGNLATISPQGGADRLTSFACTAPAVPAVSKTVLHAPAQKPDGTWTTTYRIVITNTAASPPDGLVYSLADEFALPPGVEVTGVSVAGPDGAELNPGFNGGLSTIGGADVAGDRNILRRSDRVPAATGPAPGRRTFDVTLTTEVPAGAVREPDLACPPDGTGGYVNRVALDPGGTWAIACAPIIAEPIPTLIKQVTSSSIGDDGRWTLTYDIVVTNPSSSVAGRYDLADELQFGAGVSVAEAELVRPDGVTAAAPAWDGAANTAVSRRVLLPAGAVHTYTVRVVADPAGITDDPAGDRAADCRLTDGEAGTGFRNVASLAAGATPPQSAVACDMAAESSMSKVVARPPVQNPDGTWTVVYRLTVRHRATSAGPLQYSLTDRFAFPDGIEVVAVRTDGPEGGGRLNPNFNGGVQSLGGARVSPDTSLLHEAAIAPASDQNVPSESVYSVAVTLAVPAGLPAGHILCDAQLSGGGGLVNQAAVRFGTDRLREAAACAPVPDVPVAGVVKNILDTSVQPDGRSVVEYGVDVANPSPEIATRYRLDDQFTLGDGISVVAASVVGSPPGVTVSRSWNGAGRATVAENVLLPGGATHRYRIRLTAEAGGVLPSEGAGDCVLERGERGTGFRNLATASTGLAPGAVAEACSVTVAVKGIGVDRQSDVFTDPLRLLPDTGRDLFPLAGFGLVLLVAGRAASRSGRARPPLP